MGTKELLFFAPFQFTLPCRERPRRRDLRLPLRPFQFTLPCRERREMVESGIFWMGFNSRSRVGSDSGRGPWRGAAAGFNSRSRVGSDKPLLPLPIPAAKCFNSRSRVGSDSLRRRPECRPPCFNSRSRVGSDTRGLELVKLASPFQFTLPCRERPTSRRRPPTP